MPQVTSIFDLFTKSPVLGIAFLVSLVVAITVHEFAHAWTADRLGDDTPRLMDRVTLNPLAHLDPIGSICFLLLGFGWGKPVLYNPLRLKRKSDELLIALAGPASNLILATLVNVVIFLQGTLGVFIFNADVLSLVAAINVLLAAFNMLPIPPLDGSSIVAYFWPDYRSVVGGQIGLFIVLILLVTGFTGVLMTPIITGFSHLTTLFGLIG